MQSADAPARPQQLLTPPPAPLLLLLPQLTSSKGWAGLARTFASSPRMTSASFLIKRIYERYLAPFEQVGSGSGQQCPGCWWQCGSGQCPAAAVSGLPGLLACWGLRPAVKSQLA